MTQRTQREECSGLEFYADTGIFALVSTGTTEIVRLCEALPEDKRMEVLDFARFLSARTVHPDDLAWEKLLANPVQRPGLESYLEQSAEEGSDEPLDIKRL